MKGLVSSDVGNGLECDVIILFFDAITFILSSDGEIRFSLVRHAVEGNVWILKHRSEHIILSTKRKNLL